jgi:hypothetical protein
VLGEAAQRLLGRLMHVEREFVIGAMLVAVIATIALRLRRHRIRTSRSPRLIARWSAARWRRFGFSDAAIIPKLVRA